MELFDAYDINENKLGIDMIRGQQYEKGLYHIVVEIICVNKDGRILLTRRHPNKHYPLMLEITGGSVIKSETTRQGAVRELKEETGIQVKQEDLILYSKTVSCNCLFRSFITFVDVSNDDIMLQDGETIEYKFVDVDTFLKIIDSEEFVPSLRDRLKINIEYIVDLVRWKQCQR